VKATVGLYTGWSRRGRTDRI